MKWVVILTVLPLQVGLAYAAAPTKAKSVSIKTSHSTLVKPSQHSVTSGTRAPVRGSVRVMTVSSTSSRGGSRAAVRGRSIKRSRLLRVAPPPSFQLQPDADRYREIQNALSEKGYFKGEVNGQWEDDSVGALTRFQADKGLTDDGKINALSLIRLGLGPKHDGSPVKAAPATPTAFPTAAPATADTAPVATASPSPPHPSNRQ